MKQLVFLTCLFLFSSTISYSQVTIGSAEEPLKAGLLDIKTEIAKTASPGTESSDKGLLLPRVSLVNINTLSPFINSATDKEKLEHTGLTVYNVNTTAPFLAGIYIWNGNSWVYTKQQGSSAVFGATNGISKTSTALRLGGTLIEETTINHDGQSLKFNQTTGNFTVNTNALNIANGNTGIGVSPISTAKLNVNDEAKITGNLDVKSPTSNLKKTDVIGSFIYKDPTVSDPKSYILKSSDNTGKASWVDVTTIPNYEANKYVEATFSESGINIPISTWNTLTAAASQGVNTAKLTLTPGLWLIYMSVVVEPEVVSTADADPIWARFSLRYNTSATPGTGTTGYTEINTTTNNNAYFIGGMNVSDKVYPNVSKNVVKGYLALRVLNSTKNIYLWVGTRAGSSNGFATWPTTVQNVKIADPNDPQNYIVAFPL